MNLKLTECLCVVLMFFETCNQILLAILIAEHTLSTMTFLPETNSYKTLNSTLKGKTQIYVKLLTKILVSP